MPNSFLGHVNCLIFNQVEEKVNTLTIYRPIKNAVLENRRLVVTFFFIFQTVLANYLAFILKFEGVPPALYLKIFLSYLPVLLLVRILFFFQAGLHKDLWRYASVGDLLKIVKSTTAGTVVFLVIVKFLAGNALYPSSVYVLDWLLLVMISGGSRLVPQLLRDNHHTGPAAKKILVYGAGDAGERLVRDMKNNDKYKFEVIGFIDDDPYKKGLEMHGLPIFGTQAVLGDIVEKYRPDEIVISIPSADFRRKNAIYLACKPFNIPIKTLPGLNDIFGGKVSVSQIKPLSLEDLLQRDEIRTDIKEVEEYIRSKSVLVTGAGGSIGSELSRQIFKYRPARLVLFDRDENGLFQVDHELYGKKGKVFMKAVVGDMRDAHTLENLFSTHGPHIVFHAAAHKHVPLMEFNSVEAVKNNIFGTKNLMDAAVRHGVESFVMVSTDKAVNPTNILGATRRVAEFLTMSMNSSSSTKFTTVRFGNVLGSNGSVIHTFSEQLKRGGPLTVTHPEIKRFFMLIPEAVQLVLIAASASTGGTIYVLDMGKQIRIVDLAENLIRLKGFVPHEEIKIEYVGLRPGEKLYEELFDDYEEIIPTQHEKLRIAAPHNVPTPAAMEQTLAELEHHIANNDQDKIVPVLQKIVPNFKMEGRGV
jgi:FlaA1/EpsC-like NDP-sugar epimerase